MKADLLTYRQQINAIDHQLLKLLNERQKIVRKIGTEKKQQQLPLRDLTREQAVLKQLKAQARAENLSLSDESIENIYRAIMAEALKLQAEKE